MMPAAMPATVPLSGNIRACPPLGFAADTAAHAHKNARELLCGNLFADCCGTFVAVRHDSCLKSCPVGRFAIEKNRHTDNHDKEDNKANFSHDYLLGKMEAPLADGTAGRMLLQPLQK